MDFIINLSNNPVSLQNSGDKISFKLIIKDSVYSGIEEHTLIDFGDFEIGSDDEDEVVMFPGNINVEFLLNVDIFKFENILLELKTKTVVAQVFLNTSKIFSGFVSNEDVSGEKIKRRIKLTIIDGFKKLQDYPLSTNFNSLSFGYNPENYVLVLDLIRDLLTRPEIYPDQYITEIINLHTLEVEPLPGMFIGLDYFATRIYRYFNAVFENCLQILKALIINYGCIGVIGFDNKFYLIPRKYYQGANIFELSNDMLISDPEINIVPKKDGLIMNVYSFLYFPFTDSYRNVPIMERYEGYRVFRLHPPDEESEKINMMDAGGILPSYTLFEPQSLIISGTPIDIAPISYRIKRPDGTYFTSDALYKIIFDYIWNCINDDRKEYKVEVKGNFRDLHFGQYYYFADNPNQYYRLRKASYNLKENKTTLILIDATNIATTPSKEITIDQIIDAPTAKIESDLIPIPYPLTDVWRFKSDKIYAVFDNFFASQPTTIKIFNGTQISIPIDQSKKIANSIDNYVVYMAISKNGNAPEFNYPNPEDSEADWYFIYYYPDQKHFDPLYKYRLLLPNIPIVDKKIYFWLGIQLRGADLIHGIGLHPKIPVVEYFKKIK